MGYMLGIGGFKECQLMIYQVGARLTYIQKWVANVALSIFNSHRAERCYRIMQLVPRHTFSELFASARYSPHVVPNSRMLFSNCISLHCVSLPLLKLKCYYTHVRRLSDYSITQFSCDASDHSAQTCQSCQISGTNCRPNVHIPTSDFTSQNSSMFVFGNTQYERQEHG